jgi:Glutaredoxin-like domain (DUF836)
MMKELVLYSTEHCHLCEIAQALLANNNHIFTLKIIDIADNESLLAQYGTRIPVLLSIDNSLELNWPFDEIKLNDFLAKLT